MNETNSIISIAHPFFYVLFFNPFDAVTCVQAAFDMRVRAYHVWQTCQQTLSKKREQEQKLTASGKIEKLQAVKTEIEEVGVVWLLGYH